MSDTPAIDLKAEREAALERLHEASDRRTAERLSTELWLGRGNGRIGTQEINDALAKRNMSEYSSERVDRLVGFVRDELRKRRAEYEQRRADMAKKGRKPGLPKIADWLDEQLLGVNLMELGPSEVAELARRLDARAREKGIIEVAMKQSWHKHIRPALERAGWKGGLTLGEIMKNGQDDEQEEAQASVEDVGRAQLEEELRGRRSLKAPSLQLQEAIGGNGEEVIDLEAKRLERTFQQPATAPREELRLQGPWGAFILERHEGQEDVTVTLLGRLDPADADELAAVVLRAKYGIHVKRRGE